MSVGNLKTQGNQGNNLPYQLRALQLASVTQFLNIKETNVNATTIGALENNLNALFLSKPNAYLLSKSVVWDGTQYVAFVTYATL